MMILLFLALLAGLAAAVLLLGLVFDWHLIPEAKKAWRFWSVRLNAIGLVVLSWITIDPVSVLYVWNLMPRAVTNVLPPSALLGIGAALFALSMIARLVQQPKARK